MFALSYGISVAGAVVANSYVASNPTNECWRVVGANALIPVAGPLLSIFGQAGKQTASGGLGLDCTKGQEYPIGIAVAAVDTALQVGGLILVLVGLVARTETIVPNQANAGQADGVRLAVTAGPAGAPLGLTLRVTNW